MTRDEYIRKVEVVLNGHSHQVAAKLAVALAIVPPKTRKVVIQIFVDQDDEGLLDVRVALDGPDLFVLNKAIAAHADLFATRMTQNGLDPALPLIEPGSESFSVHDALTECAASWIASVWKQTKRGAFGLPVTVVSHDGHGSTTPLHLDP